MILVTGGTGLVGSHLLHFLLRENENVRTIKRVTSDLKQVKTVFETYNGTALFNKIEWVNADILDVPSLEDAFLGITQVYHCAALVSFSVPAYQELLKVNIEGTANVVNLCLANGIKKLCHVSSVAALGESLNGSPISEENHWNPEEDNNVYAISKFGAEMEVWRGSQEGLEVIIVQPSVIIGEGHWKGASGSFFTKVKKGIPKYPQGGTGFVDVQDVTKAMCLLMQSELKNVSFIISAENLSFQEAIAKIADNVGAKAPKTPAKNWQLSLLGVFQKLAGYITGKSQSLNTDSIRSLQHISEYDGNKITTVIPFKYSPINSTLKRVCAAFNTKQRH